MRSIMGQLTRFGLVGLIGLVIDIGVFNLLRATVLSPEAYGEGPLLAKVISVSLAISANWVGNRYWTFRPHRSAKAFREGVAFAIVSIGGMLIALGCLWISHYVLGFQSALADNISANVIGLGLGTAFRFWLYRIWVFAPASTSGAPEGSVQPPRRAPLDGIEAVAPVYDGAGRNR
ncbi:GtrA family protein [Marisediminicola antarctica]